MTNAANAANNTLLNIDELKKFILPYYGMKNAELFTIKEKNTEKHRAVFQVNFNDNFFCLKKLHYGEKDILFVYSAMEWAWSKKINVPRFLPTIDRNRFIKYNNMFFILTPWIKGEKCDYDNKNHVKTSFETLGKLHANSKNFFPIVDTCLRIKEEDISHSIEKHFFDLLKFHNLSIKHKAYKTSSEFFDLYLEYFSKIFYLSDISLKISNTINNNALSTSLCHLDYVNKNILFDEHNNEWLLDFDNCALDYCVRDLGYGTRRILRRSNCSWNLTTCIDILNNYQMYSKLNLEDFKYLLCYFSFPSKTWKSSRDLLSNKKNFTNPFYLNEFKKSLDRIDEQINFVNDFIHYIENKFNYKLL